MVRGDPQLSSAMQYHLRWQSEQEDETFVLNDSGLRVSIAAYSFRLSSHD
jgi:hypothetical protein